MRYVLCSISILLTVITISSCKEKKSDSDKPVASEEATVPKVRFVNDQKDKKVAVFLNGTLFTNYIYDGRTPKPVLYPIITESGRTLTRGFPFEPRSGERVDHPHHVGLWFNY